MESMNSKYKYEEQINKLIGTIAVIDRNNFLIGGTVSYIEGDILEIETKQADLLFLGDSVKITLYANKAGIIVFVSNIIAKSKGMLYIVITNDIQKKFSNKRSNCRIDVQNKGVINDIHSPGKSEKVNFSEQPLEIEIENISISGMGFVFKNSPMNIMKESVITFVISLEEQISCEAKVLWSSLSNNRNYYGTEFTKFPDNKLQYLRAFILEKQIKKRFIDKEEMTRKLLEEREKLHYVK